MHLSKSCGVKFWTVVHGGTTSILLRAEKVFKGGQEQMDGLGMPSDDTVTEEEGLEVDASWVLRLRDPCGFQNAWVNGKCRKGRPEGVPLLTPSLNVNPRDADQQSTESVGGPPRAPLCVRLS